jgi:D-glycero-D-manno-heptose 1,7-bisphosphate phosphatase
VGIAHHFVTRAAVFLDRDGVINDPVVDSVDGRPESPHQPTDVVLAVGAVEGLRALRDGGLLLVGISNQPSAAKGKVALADLRAVHDRVAALLSEEGLALDDWRYCFHHPDGVVPDLSGPCDCRKPAPGMLLVAAHAHGIDLRASWTIGDSDSDVGAGRAAGTRTILVEHPGSAHRRAAGARPDARVRNLSEAAAFVLASGPTAGPPASLP